MSVRWTNGSKSVYSRVSLRMAPRGENVRAYLVCLVVVLWVVLEDLWLFRVLKVAHQVIDCEFFSPLFVGNEPVCC